MTLTGALKTKGVTLQGIKGRERERESPHPRTGVGRESINQLECSQASPAVLLVVIV
jgi:hypothetical protein